MIPKWLSPLFTAAVEGYAAIDRATERRRLLASAQACVDAFAKTDKPRALMVIQSPKEAKRLLPLLRTGSAVVFLDCVLERCGDEEELTTLWAEACRASESMKYGPWTTNDPPTSLGAVASRTASNEACVFVLTLQPWSTARLLLDPRVRWVILQTPPKGPLRYRPYGKRSTLLADVHDRTAERALP